MLGAPVTSACRAQAWRPLPINLVPGVHRTAEAKTATLRGRRLHNPRAQGGDSSGGDSSGERNGGDSVDIDQLAARLSREAERMRQADDSGDEYRRQDAGDAPPGDERGPPADAGVLSSLGYAAAAAGQADALTDVGDGGFYASEFELIQELGQISVQQVEGSAAGGGMFAGGGARTAAAAVIAYAATYYSGMPFQDPVTTLVKEYLPGARAVACNELRVLAHLAGMPSAADKWRVAAAPLATDPPIVRLLGYFLAGPSQRAQQLDASLAGGNAARRDTVWVVQRWDGLAPLALYPSAQQTSGLGMGRLFGGAAAALRERGRMLRAIAAGALRALGYCHERGVVHGALGSGSFLLSTFDDASSMRLVVKLDNFGFARRVRVGPAAPDRPRAAERPAAALREHGQGQVEAQGEDDTPLALGRAADLRQLAVVLLECVLSALSSAGPSDLTRAEAVQRVLGEVFDWDVAAYCKFCGAEPDWEAASALLEDRGGAGWRLVADLVSGSRSAEELLASNKFCER